MNHTRRTIWIRSTRIASRHRRPPGFSLLESLVGLFVMSVVVTSIVHVSVLAGRQLQRGAQRHLASRELANVMESVTRLDWDEPIDENVQKWARDSHIGTDCPGWRITTTVTDKRLGIGLVERRILLVLYWRGTTGRLDEQVRLATWMFRPSEPL